MSNPDDLTEALAQDGAYDPEKAEELRKKMVGAFEAKVRKAERYYWVYMCLCCWLFMFASLILSCSCSRETSRASKSQSCSLVHSSINPSEFIICLAPHTRQSLAVYLPYWCGWI